MSHQAWWLVKGWQTEACVPLSVWTSWLTSRLEVIAASSQELFMLGGTLGGLLQDFSMVCEEELVQQVNPHDSCAQDSPQCLSHSAQGSLANRCFIFFSSTFSKHQAPLSMSPEWQQNALDA